jgi:hypothetical protein
MLDWKQKSVDEKNDSYRRMAEFMSGKPLRDAKRKALRNKVTDPPKPLDHVTVAPPKPPRK